MIPDPTLLNKEACIFPMQQRFSLEKAGALYAELNETKTKKSESILGLPFLTFVDFLQ